jgi:hypothetical protein
MKKIILFVTFVFWFGATGFSYAQSCANYPYQPSENVVEFDDVKNFKIVSTASVSVDFDDASELMSARREAELMAKRSIAEYINQQLTSEDSISSEINKSKTRTKALNGTPVSSVQRDEVKKQISSINTRSDTVLKGVVPIGNCYTKGKEVRVTVGIKSETFNNSNVLGAKMGEGAASSYGSSRKNVGEKGPKVLVPEDSGTNSYSSDNQLKKF